MLSLLARKKSPRSRGRRGVARRATRERLSRDARSVPKSGTQLVRAPVRESGDRRAVQDASTHLSTRQQRRDASAGSDRISARGRIRRSRSRSATGRASWRRNPRARPARARLRQPGTGANGEACSRALCPDRTTMDGVVAPADRNGRNSEANLANVADRFGIVVTLGILCANPRTRVNIITLRRPPLLSFVPPALRAGCRQPCTGWRALRCQG